jgi:formate/nitrite transporter FocA (FNT family)
MLDTIEMAWPSLLHHLLVCLHFNVIGAIVVYNSYYGSQQLAQ